LPEVRSKISDQDLTDYALDALDPNQRLYVESMLAVSEECRNDVYEMIDLGMMLEEGFEREEMKEAGLSLTGAQREKLLTTPVKSHFIRRTAVVLAAAAAVALAFVSKEQWLPKGPAQTVAQVSTKMTGYVVQAVSAAEGEDFVSQLSQFRSKLTEDPAKWLPSQPAGGQAVFGTPASFNIEVAPHAGLGLDLMP
jgi:anti-sigma factor RsiW